MKYQTREEWLQAAVKITGSELFAPLGYSVPDLRIACGWPVRGGMAAKKRVLGECWGVKAVSDGVPQIFISPWNEEVICADGGVLPTLIHEVVHAIVGVEEKHNKVFGKAARAVGLDGKLTATVAGPELAERCQAWAEQLGDYPHKRITPVVQIKKQSTRLLKVECPECGYVCRVTRKWLDDAGAPFCPAHDAMVECPKEEKEEE